MLLGELIKFKSNINNYCHRKEHAENMINDIHTDGDIARYNESQPGGVGSIEQYNKDLKKFEDLYDKETIESIFGNSYLNASENDQQIMKYYIESLRNIYSNFYPVEIHQFYQAVNLPENLCNFNPNFKELELSTEVTDKLLSAADEVRASMITWDDKKESAKENIDFDYLSKKYFPAIESNAPKCTPSESSILNKMIGKSFVEPDIEIEL